MEEYMGHSCAVVALPYGICGPEEGESDKEGKNWVCMHSGHGGGNMRHIVIKGECSQEGINRASMGHVDLGGGLSLKS